MFTQITTLASFAVGILFLVFLIIIIFRWFLRRSSKIRANSYEDQSYTDKSIIDNPANEIDSSSFFDDWNTKKYSGSLDNLKLYYNSRLKYDKDILNIPIFLSKYIDKLITLALQ